MAEQVNDPLIGGVPLSDPLEEYDHDDEDCEVCPLCLGSGTVPDNGTNCGVCDDCNGQGVM